MRRAMLLAALLAGIAGWAQRAEETKTVRPRPATADPAVRCVLPGVPWIGFYRGGDPEDEPFPACVRAFLQYRNDDVGFAKTSAGRPPWHRLHQYVQTTSGASFRLGWDNAKWDWGAMELLGMPGDPLAAFRDGLASVGYSCEILLRQDFARSLGLSQPVDYDEAALRERIMASVAKGVPVLALGVVGPPECSLITGYDEGGKVLVGRSFFSGEADFNAGLEYEDAGGGNPDPYFRKRNWFADTRGLILIGEKIPRPSDREIHIQTLRRALEIMRTPVVRGHFTGQAAFTMWADTLLRDAAFPPADLALLRSRFEYHHGAGGTLAEARAYGTDVLHDMADAEPAAADDLREAARCFSDEHDLVWAIWEFTGGMIGGDEGARKLAIHDLRGRLVPLIRLARRRDAEAAAHFEKALELMGDKAQPDGPGNFGGVVLPGVPRVGYDVHPCPFPGSLSAVLDYLGDPVDYDYLMGVTGAAFRRLWNRDDGGNIDLGYLAPDVYRRAATAIGYELSLVPRDKQRMIRALQESLSRGRPVIAFGLIGPPEAGLVTGYEQRGEVLHGWSYFQDRALPGYYTEAGWFEKFSRFTQVPDAALGPTTPPVGLIVVGDKERWPGPSRREILIDSLKWAVDLARTARRANLPRHVSGLAAYESWAKELETDADYLADDAKDLGTRVMVHGDQVAMLRERHSAAAFLRLMSDAAPEVASQLTAAAELYDQTAGYAGQLWPWGAGADRAAQQGLVDPNVRREFAATVRQAAATEEKAVAKLEAVLKVLTSDAGAKP